MEDKQDTGKIKKCLISISQGHNPLQEEKRKTTGFLIMTDLSSRSVSAEINTSQSTGNVKSGNRGRLSLRQTDGLCKTEA